MNTAIDIDIDRYFERIGYEGPAFATLETLKSPSSKAYGNHPF